ncbi:MAG: hypothetical protein ACI88H_003653 [Cocleimonas sp.]|jgi:hypothetical protein
MSRKVILSFSVNVRFQGKKDGQSTSGRVVTVFTLNVGVIFISIKSIDLASIKRSTLLD